MTGKVRKVSTAAPLRQDPSVQLLQTGNRTAFLGTAARDRALVAERRIMGVTANVKTREPLEHVVRHDCAKPCGVVWEREVLQKRPVVLQEPVDKIACHDALRV